MKDVPYQELLKRMLTIEILGERLYNALALKTREANLKSIYHKLALNERQTAEQIRRESGGHYSLKRTLVLKFSDFIFNLLPVRFLAAILKNTLKKRMYSRWGELYNRFNPELWRLLEEHERLQHELLSPYWNKSK